MKLDWKNILIGTAGVILAKEYFGSKSCPTATKNIQVNTDNRQHTIDSFDYGPMNPSDRNYWKRIADRWKTTPDVAMQSRCGNCVAFDISPRMLDCIKAGSVSEKIDPMEEELGILGYCWMHHFKCHSARTCVTWAGGGAISKDKVSFEWQKKTR